MPISSSSYKSLRHGIFCFIDFVTIFICSNQRLSAFDLDKFVHGSARSAVIKLNVVGQTLENDKGKSEQSAGAGTAFFISKEGYALTSAHIFFKDDILNDPSKRLYPISGVEFVTGRISAASSPLRVFTLEEINPSHDVALIKLLDGQAENQKSFPVCGSFDSRTESLTAVGFTVTKGMITPTGNLLQDLDGDDYTTSIALNPGMSGGPILDGRGQVVGVAVDGIRGNNIQGLNRMLAAQFVRPQLMSANVSEDCASSLDLGEIEEQSAKYDQLIREAKEEPNQSAARGKFEDANKIKPKGWESLYGIARIDFENGDFSSAVQYATASFASKVPTDYSLLNLAALANYGSGKFAEAISAYRKIVTNIERSKSLYRDALFSLGQVEIDLFIRNGSSKSDQNLIDSADENFNSFLRINGLPIHFAYYHLACINAIEGKKDKASLNFRKARQALDAYRGENRYAHLNLMQSSLTASSALRPGDPVICPPLQKLMRQRF